MSCVLPFINLADSCIIQHTDIVPSVRASKLINGRTQLICLPTLDILHQSFHLLIYQIQY
jgi:hypothetical protein